jgi:hypothetical protein
MPAWTWRDDAGVKRGVVSDEIVKGFLLKGMGTWADYRSSTSPALTQRIVRVIEDCSLPLPSQGIALTFWKGDKFIPE